MLNWFSEPIGSHWSRSLDFSVRRKNRTAGNDRKADDGWNPRNPAEVRPRSYFLCNRKETPIASNARKGFSREEVQRIEPRPYPVGFCSRRWTNLPRQEQGTSDHPRRGEARGSDTQSATKGTRPPRSPEKGREVGRHRFYEGRSIRDQALPNLWRLPQGALRLWRGRTVP